MSQETVSCVRMIWASPRLKRTAGGVSSSLSSRVIRTWRICVARASATETCAPRRITETTFSSSSESSQRYDRMVANPLAEKFSPRTSRVPIIVPRPGRAGQRDELGRVDTSGSNHAHHLASQVSDAPRTAGDEAASPRARPQWPSVTPPFRCTTRPFSSELPWQK